MLVYLDTTSLLGIDRALTKELVFSDQVLIHNLGVPYVFID